MNKLIYNWKLCPEYEISREGQIYNINTDKLITQRNNKGIIESSIMIDGKRRTININTAILQSYSDELSKIYDISTAKPVIYDGMVYDEC